MGSKSSLSLLNSIGGSGASNCDNLAYTPFDSGEEGFKNEPEKDRFKKTVKLEATDQRF